MRLPVASSPASSCSTTSTSVATSQSASRAIVWPTARVRLTAVSKSSRPGPDQAGHLPERVDVGLGERPLPAVLGEAEGAPEPAGLLHRHPGRLGDLARVVRRRVAQDRALELLAARRRIRFRHAGSRLAVPVVEQRR